ncbi:Alpha/Beta hydrolase protein [Rhodocollybia butyracea]|uniref:Alpha/Beta hydrolase protein n=1 Tax=Rhodocollybia butyracea TaxID=206335 RepID=A0A9P5Q6F8_9AGAR|nr:Alpha/Beta hydrolase protein [Rhodocollybia butyracea]
MLNVAVYFPEDYLDSSGNASIALAIYRAKQQPRKGSVFLNPGGPGAPGTHLTLNTGRSFAKLIGDDWDLIGFDPRGVGQTRPETRCFPSTIEYDQFFANTVVEQGITISSIMNLSLSSSSASSSTLFNELVPQYRKLLELKKAQAELCQNIGDRLRYMGTTTVVKDMDFITKVLDGDDAKINYWGESYGSIIGAYLVNMLPKRAGYVVIDGIVDPVSWSNEPTHTLPAKWLGYAEKTYETFLQNCTKAGPTLCPLAKYEDEPWKNIELRFEEFFDATAARPISVPLGNRPGVLTSGAARGYLETFMYNPQRWSEAAKVYSAAFAGDATLLYNLIVPPPLTASENQSHPAPRRDLYSHAIACLDTPPPSPLLSGNDPTAEDLSRLGLQTLQTVSPHFGVSLSMDVNEPYLGGGCQFWPVRAPERFSGPWGGDEVETGLERKMVIISNTADPITPITSGLYLNSLMPQSSTMIIQDGAGHCSNALPSLCTAKLVRAYFSGNSEATIPRNGTICYPDDVAFLDPLDSEKWRLMEQADREMIQALRNIRRGHEDA